MRIVEQLWRDDGFDHVTYWNEIDVYCPVHGRFRNFDLEDRWCPHCNRETINELKYASLPHGCILVDTEYERVEE